MRLPSKQFAVLSKEYLKEIVPWFPTHATQMGIDKYDGSLESYSKDSRQEILALLKRTQRDLKKIPLSELPFSDYYDAALMNVEIMSLLLSFEELQPWKRDPSIYPETILFSAYLLTGRETSPWKQRGESLLLRMKQFPRLLKEARTNLKNPPEIFTLVAMEVTEGGILFFKNMRIPSKGVSKSLVHRLEGERTRTLEQLDEYLKWLKRELLPASSGDFSTGKSLFNRILKEQHLLSYSADDLKAIGEEYFEKTLKEMRALARAIDPEKSWMELLKNDSRRHPSPEKLLAAYDQTLQKTRNFVRDNQIAPFPLSDEIVVTETPPFNRSFIPFAAYMPVPPFASHGRGEFWVTPVPGSLPSRELELRLQEHAYHKIPLIVLHETYPGHHLQFSYLREISSPFVKRAGSSVSCEGWAFYCEEMMKEQGFYPDLLTQLSQLKDQLWRVTRVILDVGLQTGKMSPQKAAGFLVKEVKFPESMALGEVKRYVRDATQPMSYFVGKHEILKLREEFRKKKKDKFRLVDFHGEFLKCGVTPLKLAAEKILNGQ